MPKKNAEILISDVIGGTFYGYDLGITAKQVKRQLAEIGDEEVDVLINSPGGSVWEATAIAELFRGHSRDVHMRIIGIAASAASVFPMVGASVTMAKSAMLMIHDPWSITVGDAREMRKTAEMLDKAKDTIIAMYGERSSLSAEDLAAAMSEETWYKADEALKAGFIDEVEGSEPDAKNLARFDLGSFGFKRVPEELRGSRAEGPGSRVSRDEPSTDWVQGRIEREKRQAAAEASLRR